MAWYWDTVHNAFWSAGTRWDTAHTALWYGTHRCKPQSVHEGSSPSTAYPKQSTRALAPVNKRHVATGRSRPQATLMMLEHVLVPANERVHAQAHVLGPAGKVTSSAHHNRCINWCNTCIYDSWLQ